MKTFWKTHPALRIMLMIVLFVLSIALVVAGWKMTGQLAGLGIMLVGVASDAGAGAGGVVGEGDTLVVLHEGFAQGADDLFHRGGAVGGDGACCRIGRGLGGGGGGSAGVLGSILAVACAAASDHGQSHKGGKYQAKSFLHFVESPFQSSFCFPCVVFLQHRL